MSSNINDDWEDQPSELNTFASDLKELLPGSASRLAPSVFYELGMRAGAARAMPSVVASSRIRWERFAWAATVGLAFCSGLWLTRGATSQPVTSPTSNHLALDSPPPHTTSTEPSSITSPPQSDLSHDRARVDSAYRLVQDWLVGEESPVRFAYAQQDSLVYVLPESSTTSVAGTVRPPTRAELFAELVPGSVTAPPGDSPSAFSGWFSNWTAPL